MTNPEATKTALSLRDIVQYEFNPTGLSRDKGKGFFKVHHLGRERVIGFLGLRGEGKSLSAAIVSVVDEMMEGFPVWSNMSIKCSFEISDEIAQEYGIDKGGTVTLESLPLDRKALLRFDEEYHDGTLFIDEINMEFAEARRAGSNVNLWFDRVAQQLRKRRLNLVYTVIHEMWVDTRVRDELTDIFVLCKDTALGKEGRASRQRPGVKIEWTTFPMTRILTGESYGETGKSLPPCILTAKPFWGIHDTDEEQAAGKYRYTTDLSKDEAISVQIQESLVVAKEKRDWGWLTPIALELFADGRKYIPIYEVHNKLEVQAHQISINTLSKNLRIFHGIYTTERKREGRRYQAYEIPDEILINRNYGEEDIEPTQKTVAVS